MADLLRKTLTQDRQAVLVSVDATELVREAMLRLEAWPSAMIHLGQSLLAALLLQALPDRNADERIELQWRVEGPFGYLFSECRGLGRARGTIYDSRPPVASLTQSLGPGLLQVRRTPSAQKALSTTGLVTAQGNVTLDILEYLEKSEQKNCAMNLWVDLAWSKDTQLNDPAEAFEIRRAIGYLVHVLPQPSEAKTNEKLYQWDQHLRALGPMSTWVFRQDPTIEALSIISGEFSPTLLLETPVSFFCTCSEERVERAVAIAAASDLDLAAEQESDKAAQVRCEFCGRSYVVSKMHASPRDC